MRGENGILFWYIRLTGGPHQHHLITIAIIERGWVLIKNSDQAHGSSWRRIETHHHHYRYQPSLRDKGKFEEKIRNQSIGEEARERTYFFACGISSNPAGYQRKILARHCKRIPTDFPSIHIHRSLYYVHMYMIFDNRVTDKLDKIIYRLNRFVSHLVKYYYRTMLRFEL